MKKLLLPLVFLSGFGLGLGSCYLNSFKYFKNHGKLNNFNIDNYNSSMPYEIVIERIENDYSNFNDENWIIERRFKVNSINIKDLSAIVIDDKGETKRITIKAPEKDRIIAQYIISNYQN